MSEHAPTADHAHPLVPLRVYLSVFGALMVLSAATIWAAFQNFGFLNTPLALGIACMKATLVILYFMHVRYSPRLIWIFSTAAFFWVAILLLFTLGDYASRGWLELPDLPVPGTPTAR